MRMATTQPSNIMESQTKKDWSGSPWPGDRDNYWIDDDTGEIVSAETGERITVAQIKALPKLLEALRFVECWIVQTPGCDMRPEVQNAVRLAIEQAEGK